MTSWVIRSSAKCLSRRCVSFAYDVKWFRINFRLFSKDDITQITRCVSIVFKISYFWGSIAKLRKATISFVISIRPYGTTRLTLGGFLWSLIFWYFRKSAENIQVPRITECFTWIPMYIFVQISFISSLLWEMFQAKVLEKFQNTSCSITFCFLENHAVYEIR